MAFPQIRSEGSWANGAGDTTHDILIPATVVAGDRIVVGLIFGNGSGQATATWPGAWTSLGSQSITQMSSYVRYKVADGTEGGTTIAVTSDVATRSAAKVWVISGAGGIECTAPRLDTDANINPDGITATWGSADNLFLTLFMLDGSQNLTAFSSGYTGTGSQADGTSCIVAWQRKESAAASDTPGLATRSGANVSYSYTLVVEPGASTLTDVDTDETVTAGQANVIATGTNLSGVTPFQITSGIRSVNCNIDSTTATTVQFDVPDEAAIIAANVPFGSVTFSVNGGTLPGALNPSTSIWHDVSDISQIADTDCLYNGLSPAITTDDYVLHAPTTTTYGWSVTLDSQGFPIIDSGGDLRTDSFIYRVWDATTQDYGTSSTWQSTNTPTLSSVYAAATGETTASVSVNTDIAEGTVWCVITTSATTPSHAQIKAGQNHAGAAAVFAASAAGTPTTSFSPTGLTSLTGYYAHFTQENAATPARAATPVSSAQFTTFGAGGAGVASQNVYTGIAIRI